MTRRAALSVAGVASVGLVVSALAIRPFDARAAAPAPQASGPLRLAQAEVAFGRGEVVIETHDGARRFTVEIARTPEQRHRGLMFRTELDRNSGMLFVFDQPGVAQMWMKNTLIPLDMLFIAEDGRIRRIAARTTPLSEKTIASGGPVRAVLELPAGTAARLGIAEGDRVVSDAFAASE